MKDDTHKVLYQPVISVSSFCLFYTFVQLIETINLRQELKYVPRKHKSNGNVNAML